MQLVLLGVAISQAATIVAVPDSGTRQTRLWSSTTTWVGGVVPRAGDSVSIGSATARNGNQASCDTDVVVVDVVTPTLVAVTVQCVSATCQGTLRVSGAAALNAASVTINGALQLLLGSTVKATSAFNLNALGLLQGSGTIDSPASVLRGSVSPGIIMGCATSACASPFSARLPSAGTLNFPGAITTFIGANVFLKYLDFTVTTTGSTSARSTATQDSIVCKELRFSTTASKLWFDVMVSATATVTLTPFTFTTRTVDVPYTTARRTSNYPWQTTCCGTATTTSGGQTTSSCKSSSCVLSVTTQGGTTTITLADTSAWSTCDQTGGLGFVIGSTTCPAIPSTGPTTSGSGCPAPCRNGGSCVGSSCVCTVDAQSFGWTGSQCELPQCASNCNGASSGTCALAAGAATPSCSCVAPWNGPTCATLTCAPACQNGGTCELAGTTAVCNCAVGFSGTDCATVVAPNTCPPCGPRGTCGGATNNFLCICAAGWSGSACNVPVCPGFIADVTPNCGGNGICDTASAPPACQCALGWNGPECALRGCTPTFCSNGGVCAVSAVTGTDPTCACPAQFTGSTCLVLRDTASATPSWVIAVAVTVGVIVVGAIVAVTVVVVRNVQRREATDLFKKKYMDYKEAAAPYEAL